MSQTQENTESGKIVFGDKSLAYLKEMSRNAVEKYSGSTVIFFEVDYENSKRNFYGELLVKKWINPLGIRVNAIINIIESTTTDLEGIPNKLLTGEITVYIDHLKELKIDPAIGDYFTTKNRIYLIHDKTVADSNKVQVAVDREAMFVIYHVVEADSEQITGPGLDIDGTANDLKGETQS